MSLGFSVPNLGPLNQVGFAFKDIGTAVYLATKAYGWYNSRERVLSLEQTLASSGVHLIATSTFNRETYLVTTQEHCNTWGVARNFSNVISRVRLPRASTAMEGHPGVLCLRALTAGLLCFVEINQVQLILKEVIPSRLFNYEQEDTEMVIEGPFLAALTSYIRSIDTEEGAAGLRTYLLDHTDNQMQRITHATVADLLVAEQTEVGHITGFLDWLLTPALKRKKSVYRTRSLRVWCLALALSRLGFEVEADRVALKSAPAVSNSATQDEHYNLPAVVVLVLVPGWKTDHARKETKITSGEANGRIVIPPRLIPIRALPAVAYATQASTEIPLSKRLETDASDLEKAFLGTYTYIRYRLSSNAKIRRAAGLSTSTPIDGTFYKNLLDESYRMEDLGLLFDYFQVPGGGEYTQPTHLNHLVKDLMIPVVRNYLLHWKDFHQKKLRFMIDHLRQAFVLATVSLFVRDDSGLVSESGMGVHLIYSGRSWRDGDRTGSLDELYDKTFDFLERHLRKDIELHVVMDSLEGGLTSRLSSWGSLVLKVMLDIDKPFELVGHIPSHPLNGYWGAQNHGLVMINDFIMQPSARASSAYVFHSILGQLLDIPTRDYHIIEGLAASPLSKLGGRENLASEAPSRQDIITALLDPPRESLDTVRFDLEPCWESDPNTCRFVLRVEGIPRLQFGLAGLFQSVNNWPMTVGHRGENRTRRIRCVGSCNSCPGSETMNQLLFDKSNRRFWKNRPLLEMAELGCLTCDVGKDVNSKDNRPGWITQTYHSDTLLVFALSVAARRYYNSKSVIVTDCLGAALLAPDCWSAVSSEIILSDEKHSRLGEKPEADYSKRDDLLRSAAYLIFSHMKDTDRVPYTNSIFSQVCRWIWDSPTVAVLGLQFHESYPDAVMQRLVYYRAHNGITEEGTFEVLQKIDICSIIAPDANMETNLTEIAKVSDDMIGNWQSRHLTTSQLSAVKQFTLRLDEKLKRDYEHRALNYQRNMTEEQYEYY